CRAHCIGRLRACAPEVTSFLEASPDTIFVRRPRHHVMIRSTTCALNCRILFSKRKICPPRATKAAKIQSHEMDFASHRAPDRCTFQTISIRSRTAYACRPAASGLSAKFTASSLIITPDGDDV